MVFTAVHWTDTHERDLGVLEDIVNEVNPDVVFHTGDFIDRDQSTGPEIETIMERFAKAQVAAQESEPFIVLKALIDKYELDPTNIDVSKIPEEERENFQDAINGHKQVMAAGLVNAIQDSYAKMRPTLERIAEKAPIYGIAGNHDFNLIYDPEKGLGSVVKFVELEKGDIKVESKSGVEYILKGTPNTNTVEIPPNYREIMKVVGPELAALFIDYISGTSLEIAGDNEELKTQIEAAYQKEVERLGEGGADIFLTHKTPSAGLGDNKDYGTGQVGAEYSANSKMVIGGHVHGGSIIIGANGVPEFNPGPRHIFSYTYNDDKSLKHLDIYRVDGKESIEWGVPEAANNNENLEQEEAA